MCQLRVAGSLHLAIASLSCRMALFTQPAGLLQWQRHLSPASSTSGGLVGVHVAFHAQRGLPVTRRGQAAALGAQHAASIICLFVD